MNKAILPQQRLPRPIPIFWSKEVDTLDISCLPSNQPLNGTIESSTEPLTSISSQIDKVYLTRQKSFLHILRSHILQPRIKTWLIHLIHKVSFLRALFHDLNYHNPIHPFSLMTQKVDQSNSGWLLFHENFLHEKILSMIPKRIGRIWSQKHYIPWLTTLISSSLYAYYRVFLGHALIRSDILSTKTL